MSDTTQDWRTLPAGRDLDLCVALALGWHGPVMWIEDEDGRDPYAFTPDTDSHLVEANDRDVDCIVPWFSTNTNDALDLVSALRARGVAVGTSAQAAAASGVPVPLAICHAALAAMETTP